MNRENESSMASPGSTQIRAASEKDSPRQSHLAELAILRRAVEAAKSEIRAAKLEAESARGAARAAEKALRRERTRTDKSLGSKIFDLVIHALSGMRNSVSRRRSAGRTRDLENGGVSISPQAVEMSSPAVRSKIEGGDIQEPDLFTLRVMNPQGRVAVVAHLPDPDIWPELRHALSNISEPFDLFVSLREGTSDQASARIHEDVPAAQVIAFPNRGRDVFPFVALINSGVLFRYSVVCKICAKDAGQGQRWDQNLVGDRAEIENIITAFDANPNLGIVLADAHLEKQESHRPSDRLNQLCRRLGMYQSKLPERIVCASQSYWIRPFLLRMIAGLKLTANDFESDPLPSGGGTAYAVEELLGIVCRNSGMQMAGPSTIESQPSSTSCSGAVSRQHLIAFYLPQFHPIPENDAWWGAGFTEWTNVTRTRPLFTGHRQPRLPADLGYYDLRLPEAREAQAQLARQYGLAAFCYYYYWFDGQKLLQRPLEEVLAAGEPDFPFLLLWANEPWTRGWNGRARDILMPQEYRRGWVRRLAEDVAPLLRDPRYFRFLGAPVFLIYRVRQFRTGLRHSGNFAMR